MSAGQEQMTPDGPISIKRAWGAKVPDLRAAASYPTKQVPGIALLFGMASVCMYGLWRVAQVNKKRKYVLESEEKALLDVLTFDSIFMAHYHLYDADKNELAVARVHLLPLLQAEADRRYLRERKQSIEEEEKIMDGVEGWVVGESVYKTRWMPPAGPLAVHKL